ncbi:unnamed protein product [Camellia sinensis]
MPSIISNELNDTKSIKISDIRSNGDFTLRKRRLRSDSAAEDGTKSKSPRRCINGGLNCTENGIIEKESGDNKVVKSRELLVKKLSDDFIDKPKWNPRDAVQLSAVKEALHVSTAPHTVVCREDEKKRVLEFCKQCIEQEKAGSLYVCGCPGTGKSLLMERVKDSLVDWAQGAGFQPPDVLAINCTSLTNTSEIFSKILGKNQLQKKTKSSTSPLKHLQNLYSQKQQSTGLKMMLIIADELDYLITKDRAVLHDLFMLTTFPFARCILIGIANAIDLADRFLPRLQSLNCKPMMVTFRAYSKDQIIMILQRRLMALPYLVFQPQALELCARKVAAASGDMRKALCICRSAIELLQAELRESACNLDFSLAENGYSNQQTTPACDLIKQGIDIVRVDHMAIALSKTYRSPIMDTIQSLPQHQQIILCSAVKLFRGGKKDTTIGELSKSYLDICKLTLIPPVGIMELSSMCRVLGDQGLLKLGQSREDKLRRVTLKVDEADVAFALQGIRVFRNCLNACQ